MKHLEKFKLPGDYYRKRYFERVFLDFLNQEKIALHEDVQSTHGVVHPTKSVLIEIWALTW